MHKPRKERMKERRNKETKKIYKKKLKLLKGMKM